MNARRLHPSRDAPQPILYIANAYTRARYTCMMCAMPLQRLEHIYISLTGCQDQPDFLDNEAEGCYEYVTLGYCLDGGYGPAWEASWGQFSDYAVDGIDASQACCACGGGNVEVPDWICPCHHDLWREFHDPGEDGTQLLGLPACQQPPRRVRCPRVAGRRALMPNRWCFVQPLCRSRWRQLSPCPTASRILAKTCRIT